MGWWWSSNSQDIVTDSAIKSSSSSASSSSHSAAQPRDVSNGTGKQSARFEADAQDLAQYLPVFSDSAKSPTSTTLDDSTSSLGRHGKKDSDSHKQHEHGFEVPYPQTMSCREAFDQAYHCQSMSGQFLNVYRYGTYRQCKEQWGQFWFCMRNRGKPDDVKRELIREFYREKEEKYGHGPSSEDIWDPRTERIGKAFDLGFDEVELEDTRKR